MTDPSDTAARMTLKLAGQFQEIRDRWAGRLSDYFAQLESLVEGEWLDTDDLKGVIRESQLAAREALDGLGGDLSAVLVHESGGLFARFEEERQALLDQIYSLRSELAAALSGDTDRMRAENHALREAIQQVPEFKLLRTIQKEGRSTYKSLARMAGMKLGMVKKLVKSLASMGYVSVDKKSRPHAVVFLSAPWNISMEDTPSCRLEFSRETYAHSSALVEK